MERREEKILILSGLALCACVPYRREIEDASKIEGLGIGVVCAFVGSLSPSDIQQCYIASEGIHSPPPPSVHCA